MVSCRRNELTEWATDTLRPPMPPSAVRCSKARFLSLIVLVALSREVAAQPDPAPQPTAAPPPAAAPGASRPPAAAPTPSESEEAGVADEGARALERALVRE